MQDRKEIQAILLFSRIGVDLLVALAIGVEPIQDNQDITQRAK